MLYLRRALNSAPSSGTLRINKRSKFASSLISAWETEEKDELVNRLSIIKTADPTRVASLGGAGYKTNGSTQEIQFPLDNRLVAGDGTIAVFFVPKSFGSYACVFDAAIFGNRMASVFIADTGNINYYGWGQANGSVSGTTGWAIGNPCVIVARRIGSTLSFFSGPKPAIASVTNSSAAGSVTYASLGLNPSGGGLAMAAVYTAAFAWSRGLSDSDVIEFVRNRFALYEGRNMPLPLQSMAAASLPTVGSGTAINVTSNGWQPRVTLTY